MVFIKRLVLDVPKPHQPDAVEFCRANASVDDGYRVRLTVVEMDEKTETLELESEGGSIDLRCTNYTRHERLVQRLCKRSSRAHARSANSSEQ